MYKCKKCDSNEYVKVGFVNGKQHYKCKKMRIPALLNSGICKRILCKIKF